MTGNVAQVFLTDDDLDATLHGIHAALRPGGHLVFESRRPERRAWLEWAQDPAGTAAVIDGVGPVTLQREVTAVDLPLVSFRQTYTFADGTQLVSESTLRFRSQAEIEHRLAEAGFLILDVTDAPDRPGHEFVFIAQKRT